MWKPCARGSRGWIFLCRWTNGTGRCERVWSLGVAKASRSSTRATTQRSGRFRWLTNWRISSATTYDRVNEVAARIARDTLDVLDGLRPANPHRAGACGVASCVAWGVRPPVAAGRFRVPAHTPDEREAEEAADRLAFELLAPCAEVGDVADHAALVTPADDPASAYRPQTGRALRGDPVCRTCHLSTAVSRDF